MRREFLGRVKVAAFARANGSCEGCGARLTVGKYAYDHDTPDGLGGLPTLQNCRVLCTGPGSCHSEKTRLVDVPTIAKAKRSEARHLGAKVSQNPLPFGKRSPFKKRIDGSIVRREAKP